MDTTYNPIAVLAKYNIEYYDDPDTEWIKVFTPFAKEGDSIRNAHGGVHRFKNVFHCFKSSQSITFVAYLQAATGISQPNLEKELLNFFSKSPVEDVTETEISIWTRLLLSDAGRPYLTALKAKGIGPNEVVKYKLGLNQKGRVTIPVYSADGMLLNVRMYDVLKQHKLKYTNYKNAESRALFLPKNLDSEVIYIAGGEPKAMLMESLGYPVIAPTFGEKKWPDKFINLLKGKKAVYIVYDVDDTGRKAAAKLAAQIAPWVEVVKDIFLEPVATIKGGDITDFFITRGLGKEDFDKLVEGTPAFATALPAVVVGDEEIVGTFPLSKSIDAAHYNKMVQTHAVVSAKDTQPYVVPKKVEVVCPGTGQEVCAACKYSIMNPAKPERDVEVDKTDPRLLKFIECSEIAQQECLKAMSAIPNSCKLCRFNRLESYNIEVLRAIPQTAVGHNSSETSPKTLYYVGQGLDTNVEYNFTGRNTSEPKTQRSTLIITDAERAVSDIDTFALHTDLRCFSPAEWTYEALCCKLDDIYEDLENNVTGIFHRRDMHITIDLVYHSVLYLSFQNKTVKGWTDILLIGDSGQGKSETAGQLLAHYKAGEKVDTKRATIAGLVGGAQQTNKRWFISWGTIPLNDRRLVLLEEVKGCSEEVLAKLTDMRSSGVADIQMVERARTNARTRLLWISNQRSTRNINDYNYGTDAVLELIGSKEDVRRFDMAMAVATGEVSIDVVHGEGGDKNTPHFYTSELCNHLIMWGWSRRPEQVTIEEDAEREILAASKRMSQIYSSSVPLVEPSDQRHKILRLAAALAVRTFSTDDGETLVVRKCHVQYIEALLYRVYDSEALGYREYSKSRFTEAVISDPKAVEDELRSLSNHKSLIEAWLYSDVIQWNDVADFCDLDREGSMSVISVLVRNGAVRKLRRGGYRKTPAFIELLKEAQRSGTLVDGPVELGGEL